MDNRPIGPYNILLPIWLRAWFPSWLWLILVPANYLVDRLVLSWSLGDMEDKGTFCRENTWRVCVAGFMSDFTGRAPLLVAMVFLGSMPGVNEFAAALTLNPFANIFALLVTLAAIALAGFCIFRLDRWLLGSTSLDPELVRKAALRRAIITAP